MEEFVDGALESCELINEKIYGTVKYYLKLVYIYENDNYKYKITFPRVPLPINKLVEIKSDNEYDIATYNDPFLKYKQQCYIQTSNVFGDYSKNFKVEKSSESYQTKDGKVIDLSSNPAFYIKEEIEKKCRKMTLKEIEKELGCNIELISKEESH